MIAGSNFNLSNRDRNFIAGLFNTFFGDNEITQNKEYRGIN